MLVLFSVATSHILPASAGETDPSLLFNDARGFSLRLRADAARQEAARADLLAAEWAFLPTLGASADWVLDGQISYTPDLPHQTPDTVARKPPTTVGLSLSVNIFDGLKRVNMLRSAQMMVLSGNKLTADAEQQLYLDTASAALAVIRDRKIVALRQKAVSDRHKSLIGADYMLKDQVITRTDVSMSAIRADSAEVALEDARGQLAQSEADFARLTGRRPPASLRLAVPAGIPHSADEAAIRAENGNPKAEAASLAATAAKYQAEATIANFLPTVDFVAQAGAQFDANPAYDRVDSYSAMVKIRVPLFDPAAFPKLTGARAVAKQKFYEAQDGHREAGAAARALFLQRASLSKAIAILSRQINDAREAAKGMAIEQEAGTRTLIDVLDAQQAIVDADVARVQAEYDRDRAGFMLLASAGALGDQQFASR